jgi:hypothetical protein
MLVTPFAKVCEGLGRPYFSLFEGFLNSLSWGLEEVELDSTRIRCPVHYKDDIVDVVDHIEAYACDTLHKQGQAVV